MKSEPKLSSVVMRLISAIVIVVIIAIALASFSEASQKSADNRTGKFFLGTSLGVQTDTADGSAFALGLYGDYFLTPNFSIGPLLQVGLTGDLSQLGLSAQAKYTFDIADAPKFRPYVQAGIGLIYAELDWRGGSHDDTSYLIPLGIGAEYKLTNSLLLDGGVLVNINDLDFQDGNSFVTWFIGVKFPF